MGTSIFALYPKEGNEWSGWCYGISWRTALELEALLGSERLPTLTRWEEFEVLEHGRGWPELVRVRFLKPEALERLRRQWAERREALQRRLQEIEGDLEEALQEGGESPEFQADCRLLRRIRSLRERVGEGAVLFREV
ncbi:hypothetical protein [Thermoflexus hugenholtzii]